MFLCFNSWYKSTQANYRDSIHNHEYHCFYYRDSPTNDPEILYTFGEIRQKNIIFRNLKSYQTGFKLHINFKHFDAHSHCPEDYICKKNKRNPLITIEILTCF